MVPSVRVLVTKRHPSKGRFVYRYRVINGSSAPVTDLMVGRYYFSGLVELRSAPMGWNGESVPSSSYKSPPGWQFEAMVPEEDSVGYVRWSITEARRAIAAGDSLGGFEVTVPVDDLGYDGGHWTVLLDSAEEPVVSAGLQPVDR